MNRNIHTILRTVLPVFSLLVTSCGKDDTDPPAEPPRLQVDAPAEIVFTAEGTSPDATVKVACNRAWSVHPEPSDGNGWLRVGARNEASFTLEAAVNDLGTAPEPVRVQVRCEGVDPVSITVRQEAADLTPRTQISIEGVADGTEFTVVFANSLRSAGTLEGGRLAVEGLTGSVRTIYSIESEQTEKVLVGREQTEPIRLAFAPDGKLTFRTDAEGRRLVNTFSELAAIGADAASMQGNYLQESDIDMLGHESLEGQPRALRQNWTPLGFMAPFDPGTGPNPGEWFRGRYDGGGYRLENLWMERSDNAGLFAGIGPDGVVASLTVASGVLRGAIHCGAICCYNYGTVEKCVSMIPVRVLRRAGGICGYNFPGATIRDCDNEGDLGGDISLGGICGVNSGLIEECRNRGAIAGDPQADIGGGNLGGICGTNGGEIRGCRNAGAVEGFYDLGGICGNNSGMEEPAPVLVTACFNEGTITGRPNKTAEKSQNVGGIAGENNHATLSACSNAGEIRGELYVGGINGYNWGEIVATHNAGTIAGYGYVAGITGYIASDAANPGVLRASYNRGAVSATLPAYAAGICSFVYGSVRGCYYLQSGEEVGVNYAADDAVAEALEFGAEAWPAATDAGWKVGNSPAEGCYWKRLGGWNAGGTPPGASSEFPALWWE